MSSIALLLIAFGTVLPISAIDFGMSEIKYRTYGALMPPKPATTTPCCVDTLTPGVCHSMLSNDHENFINMCRKNADFSFMQCCYTCHFSADAYTGLAPSGVELYNMDAKMLLLNPVSEFHKCSDRHSNAFCDSLLGRHGQWALKKISCDNASLAFRICRRTCGYCTSFLSKSTINYNGTEARDMKKCMRLF